MQWDAYAKESELAALKQTPLYSDPKHEFLLAGIVGRMQEAIETTYGPQPHYNIHLVADNSINAFATGGQVFVNRGTLLFFLEPRSFWYSQGFDAQATENAMRQITPWSNDIEALTFILAHEVGHNVLGHPTSAVGFICGQHLDAVQESQVRAQKRAAKDEERQRSMGTPKGTAPSLRPFSAPIIPIARRGWNVRRTWVASSLSLDESSRRSGPRK